MKFLDDDLPWAKLGIADLWTNPLWGLVGLQASGPGGLATSEAIGALVIPTGAASELTFISGITTSATVAATSFWTWNFNKPATYDPHTSWAAKWGDPNLSTNGTPGGTVTYWFDASSNWSTTERTALSSGLALWSAEANINFALASSAATANFIFYRGNDGSAYQTFGDQFNATAVVGSTVTGTPLPTGSYISIDTSVGGFGPIGSQFSLYGGYTYQTLVHEIGHMIGLGHGGPYNGDVNPATQQFSPYDTRLWTLMSYIDPWDSSAKYYSSYPVSGTFWGISPDSYYYEPTTPMILDVLAAQQIYGLPTSGPLVGGGLTFGFHSTVTGLIAPYFDFTVNKNPVITIWAGGTNNTLDLSGFTAGATISLTPGTFTSANGETNNIGIAEGTVITAAIGGSGNDTFLAALGNQNYDGGLGTDTFTGGAGNDQINGGGGNDTAVWSGKHTDYSVTYDSATQTYTVSDLRSGAPDGVDTVTNVESFKFSDGTFSPLSLTGQIPPPVISQFSPDTGQVGDGLTKATQLTLSGTAQAGSTVKVYEGANLLGTVVATTGGTWSLPIAQQFGNGGHDFTATATDTNNNTSAPSSVFTVVVDAAAPAAPTITFSPDTGTAGDGITKATALTLSGIAEAGSTVQVYDGATLLGQVIATGGAWSLPVSGLSSTQHSFKATATDAAGNVSLDSAVLSVRVDTVAPLAPAITMFSPDTGATGDGATTATQITLTGTAEANSTVLVYEGTTLLGQAAADGSGAWSFPTASLSLGTHNFKATATDAAGNVSGNSTVFSVRIDATTAAPPPPAITLFSPDTGVSGDHITKAAQLTLSGSAQAGSTVTVYEGADSLGSVIAAGNGTWSLPIGQLGDGPHSFTATATNGGITSNASQAFAVTIDTVAPNAPLTTNITLTTISDTLSGTAEANSRVDIYDGSTLLGSTTANGSGAWSISLALGNTVHRLTERATDAAGNTSEPSGLVLIGTDPSKVGRTFAGGADILTGASSNDILAGLGADDTLTGAGGNDRIDGGTGTDTAVWSGQRSDYAFDYNSATQTYTVSDLRSGAPDGIDTVINVENFKFSDGIFAPSSLLGNISPPVISQFSPDTGVAQDGITKATQLTLSGTAPAGSTVKVYEGAALLGSVVATVGGTWSLPIAQQFGNGSHNFTATATDADNNTSGSSSVFTVVVDTVAPSVPTITFSPDTGTTGDGITKATSLTLSGTAEAGSTVQVYDGATLLGQVTATGGTWSLPVSGLSSTLHSFKATATDAAGNVSNPSAVLSVQVDTTAPAAPAITLFSPDTSPTGDGATTATQITLTGTAEANSTVQVYDGAALLGQVTANGGAWSFPTASLSGGTHNFKATATDAAGNVSIDSTVFSVRIDATTGGPPVPTISLFSPDTGVSGDGITKATQVTLSGSAQAGTTVTVYEGANSLGSVVAAGNGTWSLPTGQLGDGPHSFTATATSGGITSAASQAFAVMVDTIAPAAPVATGVVVVSAGMDTLNGTAEANSRVDVYEGSTLLGSTTANGSGAWSITLNLGSTVHQLTETSTDAAGNTSQPSGLALIGLDQMKVGRQLLGADDLTGTSGNDLLAGLGANDTLTGGGGNDRIDGGTGTDTAVWSGKHTDYAFNFNSATQSYTVSDLRSGAPDGIDTVINVESFKFSDGIFTPSTLAQSTTAPVADSMPVAVPVVQTASLQLADVLGSPASTSFAESHFDPHLHHHWDVLP